MDKKLLHHLWTRIRPLKIRYILALLLVLVGVSIFALRQNNLGMVRLREEVYKTDQANGDVEKALQELRTYVHSHMNTDLAAGNNAVYPPIQLKYTYQRLQQAEQDRVKNANAQIYTDAQAHCERLFPGSFSGGPRVPCIEAYVSERGVKVQAIPDALYKFDFISPVWSPDLAGFSVLASALVAVLLLLRIAAGVVLKPLVK